MPSRLIGWLEAQPDGRRQLYSALIALTLLTLPCYAGGLVLRALDVRPAPAPERVPTAEPAVGSTVEATERTIPSVAPPPTWTAAPRQAATEVSVEPTTEELPSATPELSATAPATATPPTTATAPATSVPTQVPTAVPTSAPTVAPTAAPTEAPTAPAPPTAAPEPSGEPPTPIGGFTPQPVAP